MNDVQQSGASTGSQSTRFLDAADDYYRRNKADFGKRDLVTPLIERVGIKPQKALEIGCANGWRLEKLQQKFGCEVRGLEPSPAAVADAQVPVDVGTADNLPYDDMSFSLVIVGFCMWLIEPELWMRVAAEVDRVLMNGGALIVHDYVTVYPIRWERWADGFGGDSEKGKIAWFYDFPQLWLSHPFYSVVTKDVITQKFGEMFVLEQAVLLRKSWSAFLDVRPA